MTSQEIQKDFRNRTMAVSNNSRKKRGKVTLEGLAYETIEDILNIAAAFAQPPKLVYAREIRRGNVILRKK